MPRSTLQGRMAISEQPDPMLDSHPITQSGLFPLNDIFQPAPGRDLTLTRARLGSHPTVQKGAQHPAACNLCMNPSPPPSLTGRVPAFAAVGSLHKQQFPSFLS